MPPPDPPPAPSGEEPRDVILLGASNLTRAISIVVETARLALGGPLCVRAALGHGRAYGTSSRMLLRTLPAIVDCGLWETGAGPGHALVTDIGNDLLYGATAEALAGRVCTCLDRLEVLGARTVLTQVPLDSVRRIGRVRYGIMRALLFPGSGVDFARALTETEALAERLQDLAATRNVMLVHPRPAWYGLDPIHIRRRAWPEAWAGILESWAPGPGPPPHARPSVTRWWTLRRATPERWWLAGRERSTLSRRPVFPTEPGFTFSDGCTA